jgi:transposase
MFDWRKQYLDGRLDVNGRECALLPVTVTAASDSGAAEADASTRSAHSPGTLRIKFHEAKDTLKGSSIPTHFACDPVPDPLIR